MCEARRDRSGPEATNSETADANDELQSMYDSKEVSIPNVQFSQGQLYRSVTDLQQLDVQEDPKKRRCCECIPICLPLITLISTPGVTFDNSLLIALVDWARTMSWGSFCSDHLKLLAVFLPRECKQSKDRKEAIHNLDKFYLRWCYKSIGRGDFLTFVS